MSPRAAWRLEQLGFPAVNDYTAGKVDWIAAGLATVRADPRESRAVDALTPPPATVVAGTVTRPDQLPTDGPVIVVNEHDVVLGRVSRQEWTAHPGLDLEGVMRSGPTTVRAHEPLEPLRERMRSRKITEVIVTTPEGTLLGVVSAEG